MQRPPIARHAYAQARTHEENSMAKQKRNGKQSGKTSGDGKSVRPAAPPLKTYQQGKPFPGRIGRTYAESEPAFPVPPTAPAGAPNILYVVIDDVGYGACDTFGGLVETPHITRLAEAGLRYTNFHTTALCSPTRACLLTGRNHHSVGMANITELATGFPGYDGRQKPDKAAVATMLHQHGYASYALGKWHNTPSEETGPTGPFDRWPDGPLFGFDRFYGFMGGDSNQWYPKLYAGREPIDQPRLPKDGYHLSEDLVDKAIDFISSHESTDPDRPWCTYLAFGACHAPHHVWKSWVDKYRGKFDMGWDKYREQVLARQRQMGVVQSNAELPAMLDGVQPWADLSADEQRLFARMAETFAGYLSHTDAQIGRLIEFLESTGDLDNTLVFVFIGDNGCSGEGTLNGLFNELANATVDAAAVETLEQNLKRIDQLGQPGSYNHFPVGWALAFNTPYKLCKQYTHFGGTRNPLVVHWPKGIRAKGEIRTQFHHVIDVVPTILSAIGIEPPETVNSIQQAPLEGVPMNYTFDDRDAPTTHSTQYFEMLGNRALVDRGWKVVTYHGRRPWENKAAWSFDDDHWELYDLASDPTECRDLVADKDAADLRDPMVKKMIEMVGLWWAEAGRYNVLPLDDRFQERLLGRAGLAAARTRYVFREGAVRIPEAAAPDTKNRSWSLTAELEIPEGVGDGPIAAIGGDTAGWSLYLNRGVPTFCYNYAGVELTYVRAPQPLGSGHHSLRVEFEIRTEDGKPAGYGAGGMARLIVNDSKVAEAEIPRTMAFAYSLDETFDIGCDKGAPVTDEYEPQASFTGKIVQVAIDLNPELAFEVERHTSAQVTQAMVRQ
jgi:arylsulfatase